MQQYIGNDIVDLTTFDALFKSQNHRFVKRVLAISEEENLKEQNNVKDQDLYLWSCWAAKEAIYKVIKKIEPDTVFSHSKFIVSKIDLELLIKENKLVGTIVYNSKTYPVLWELTAHYIHCIALNKGTFNQVQNPYWEVKKTIGHNQASTFTFSKQEEISIHSNESRQVRVLAKEMLSKRGFYKVEVIRHSNNNNGYLPPILNIKDESFFDFDISMSHDGDFVSCGIILN